MSRYFSEDFYKSIIALMHLYSFVNQITRDMQQPNRWDVLKVKKNDLWPSHILVLVSFRNINLK